MSISISFVTENDIPVPMKPKAARYEISTSEVQPPARFAGLVWGSQPPQQRMDDWLVDISIGTEKLKLRPRTKPKLH
jgi:hypothetical protein